MIEQGYLIDTLSLQKKFYEIIDRLKDPIDFALILKPYLSHVNSYYLYTFYHLLHKNINDKNRLKSEAYWLIQDCKSNERVYILVKELIKSK